MEAVSFSPHSLWVACAYTRAFIWTLWAPNKYSEALWRESRESRITNFLLYQCHNHLRFARLKGCHTDWAHTAASWLSHDELLGTHSLVRAVNHRLSDSSFVLSRINLSTDQLSVQKRWSKVNKDALEKILWPSFISCRLRSWLVSFKEQEPKNYSQKLICKAVWDPILFW